jgi:hypothetical protein
VNYLILGHGARSIAELNPIKFDELIIVGRVGRSNALRLTREAELKGFLVHSVPCVLNF